MREMERRFRAIYREAQSDIIEKLNAHTQALYAKDAAKRAQVAAGTLSKQDYDNWLNGQVFIGKQWKDKVDSVATSLLYANQQANDIVEGKKRAVFGENATFQAYSLEHDAGMDLSFGVYDSATVTRLIKEQPELLPRRKIDENKDRGWNQTKISNAITQGVIQGESIPQIANRIARDTASSNEKAMVRYARTAMTGAQNAGRMEMLHEAQGMGIKVKKKWLATLDSRTRDAHANLDGQTAEVDEPFKSDLGPIMYPGDFSAHPANVWNCRCTMIYEYPEYMPENAQRRAYNEDRSESELISDMTYKEWKAWKAGGTQSAAQDMKEAIAGVLRGNPMTHAQADTGRVNPHYGEKSSYGINCQSCVATYEARLRGYDVEVVPNDAAHPACEELAKNTRLIWKNKDGSDADFFFGSNQWTYKGAWTGEAPTAKRFEKKLLEVLDDNGRYTLQFKWKGFNAGHIVSLQKDVDQLVIYDPQSNKLLRGSKVSEYLERLQYRRKFNGYDYYNWPGVIRVDDKDFNFDMANKVMIKAEGKK
jgi:SPP1 gp7 family putative phage head morphogenesis protein